jgi:hypothetical protein
VRVALGHSHRRALRQPLKYILRDCEPRIDHWVLARRTRILLRDDVFIIVRWLRRHLHTPQAGRRRQIMPLAQSISTSSVLPRTVSMSTCPPSLDVDL